MLAKTSTNLKGKFCTLLAISTIFVSIQAFVIIAKLSHYLYSVICIYTAQRFVFNMFSIFLFTSKIERPMKNKSVKNRPNFQLNIAITIIARAIATTKIINIHAINKDLNINIIYQISKLLSISSESTQRFSKYFNFRNCQKSIYINMFLKFPQIIC